MCLTDYIGLGELEVKKFDISMSDFVGCYLHKVGPQECRQRFDPVAWKVVTSQEHMRISVA